MCGVLNRYFGAFLTQSPPALRTRVRRIIADDARGEGFDLRATDFGDEGRNAAVQTEGEGVLAPRPRSCSFVVMAEGSICACIDVNHSSANSVLRAN